MNLRKDHSCIDYECCHVCSRVAVVLPVLVGVPCLWALSAQHMFSPCTRDNNEMHTTTYVPIYVLVRYTMKNAARCDTHCELYDSVNQLNFEHVMYCRNASECLSVSVETIFTLWNCNVYDVHVSVVISVATCDWHIEYVAVMCVAPCNSVFATACPIGTCTCWTVRDIIHPLSWHDRM